MYEIVCKLKALKAEFRKQRKLKGDLTANVMLAKRFLDKAQTLFAAYKVDILLHLVKCCRLVYSEAIKVETSMLKQRAKLRWMKYGDQSSKVFFRKISSTRAKQRVFQVTKATGEYQTTQDVDISFLRQELKHILTIDEANLLDAPVTGAEIKAAFFDIDEDSAPGPDGYTSAFYKAAWPVIGQAISRPLENFSALNAFVPGRSISDNILLAQELLAGYNQVRLPPRCTLKVDIQKAYDSVEWDFLLEVFKDTLREFASLSGLTVNPAKSQIILSKAVRQERQLIIESLGFQEGSLPVKYLGVPLTASRLTIADCSPLINKVDARLAGWNHLNLSYAGRVQLIKSVLNSLHTYWASVLFFRKAFSRAWKKR
ncbi:UNVERIFIED_CONTAM: hypothetical protein Sangu_3164600 [Sesamum angustifolium]|uniref:Reverse transcriptase domain-containing protein n=1 Tax=Sesamum angustifolium TaxID=2727405 RepID=A0AAW2JVC4_9LAMI